jgi:hypothetical protein
MVFDVEPVASLEGFWSDYENDRTDIFPKSASSSF